MKNGRVLSVSLCGFVSPWLVVTLRPRMHHDRLVFTAILRYSVDGIFSLAGTHRNHTRRIDYESRRDVSDILTKPGEEVFEAEKSGPQATLGTALIMMVIAAVVGAVFTLLRGWMFQAQLGAMGGFEAILQQADLPPELSAQLTNSLSTSFFTPNRHRRCAWRDW
jgi:hypothetical protein